MLQDGAGELFISNGEACCASSLLCLKGARQLRLSFSESLHGNKQAEPWEVPKKQGGSLEDYRKKAFAVMYERTLIFPHRTLRTPSIWAI